MRRALIRSSGIAAKLETISAYMPDNYTARVVNADVIEISGTDHAGWTLQDYVIPRLASGLYFCEEVTP